MWAWHGYAVGTALSMGTTHNLNLAGRAGVWCGQAWSEPPVMVWSNQQVVIHGKATMNVWNNCQCHVRHVCHKGVACGKEPVWGRGCVVRACGFHSWPVGWGVCGVVCRGHQ